MKKAKTPALNQLKVETAPLKNKIILSFLEIETKGVSIAILLSLPIAKPFTPRATTKNIFTKNTLFPNRKSLIGQNKIKPVTQIIKKPHKANL